jgi:hypothetical protein
MTQYMLAVHHDVDQPMPDLAAEEQQERFATVSRFNQKLVDEGSFVFGGGLQPPTTATMVRAHTGDVLITDGPYAETKEYLGGFWVITAPDLDAALELAQQASAACQEPVEVRPFEEG